MNKEFGFLLILLGVIGLGGIYFGLTGIAIMFTLVGILTLIIGD